MSGLAVELMCKICARCVYEVAVEVVYEVCQACILFVVMVLYPMQFTALPTLNKETWDMEASEVFQALLRINPLALIGTPASLVFLVFGSLVQHSVCIETSC